MASSIFILPGFASFSGGNVTFPGNVTATGVFLASDGTAAAPSYSFTSATTTGFFRIGGGDIVMSSGGTKAIYLGGGYLGLKSDSLFAWSSTTQADGNPDVALARAAANALALKNGTNAQEFRLYGYESGARSIFQAMDSVTTAVTLSGATSGTGNVIPAGATVVGVATTTTTTITNATGYTVGDGGDADRWGSKTGTAVGTNTGSTDYTADPRWWTNAARAITLTALTANFTGGVVQVTVFYLADTAA